MSAICDVTILEFKYLNGSNQYEPEICHRNRNFDAAPDNFAAFPGINGLLLILKWQTKKLPYINRKNLKNGR